MISIRPSTPEPPEREEGPGVESPESEATAEVEPGVESPESEATAEVEPGVESPEPEATAERTPTPPPQRERVTGAEVLQVIRRASSARPAGPVVIADRVVTSAVDLSYVGVPVALRLERCTLEGGLDATEARLLGLELCDVTVDTVSLDGAFVDGDLRLVRVAGVQAPGTDEAPHEGNDKGSGEGADEDAADVGSGPEPPAGGGPTVPPPPSTRVSCDGLVVSGATVVQASEVSDDLALITRGPARTDGSGTVDWEKVGQVVGLASGLTAWVAVVGGATLWARMESIDAPSLPTLAALGQSWVLTAGLQTLLVPILLGATASLLLYYSRAFPDGVPPRTVTWAERGHSRPVVAARRLGRAVDGTVAARTALWVAPLAVVLYVAGASWLVLVATAALLLAGTFVRGSRWIGTRGGPAPRWAAGSVAVAGVVLSMLTSVTAGWLGFIGVVTVLCALLALGASVDQSVGGSAVVLFVAIVVWSGAIQYASEIGAKRPAFPQVTVTTTDAGSVTGLLVGRTSDLVLVADLEAADGGRTVTAVPGDRVREVQYGATVVPRKVDPEEEEESRTDSGFWGNLWNWLLTTAGPGASVSVPTPTTTPTPTPTRTPAPFGPSAAVAVLDAEVGGGEVRVELLGVRRSGEVVHLGMRVVNLETEQSRTAASMLGLPGGDLDTPRLVDPVGLHSFQVSRTATACDCAGRLDTVVLGPGESRTLDAVFVLPPSVGTVDVVLPVIGTSRGVAVG